MGEIIFFEGSNEVGKTSLIQSLSNIINEQNPFSAYVFSRRIIPKDNLENLSKEEIHKEMNRFFSEIIDLSYHYKYILVDRFLITEYVYGKIFRNYDCEVYINTIKNIIDTLTKSKTIFIESDFYHIEDERKSKNMKMHLKIQDEFKNAFKKFGYKEGKNFKTTKIKDISKIDEISEYIYDWIQEKFIYDFYLASPFFTKEQIEEEERIKNILRENGYFVFAPYEHGVISENESKESLEEIFLHNVEAINKSRMVLAITDRKDMGTIWEAGYAYGRKTPVIYYAETLGNNKFNLMLSESGEGIFLNEDQLLEAIKENNFKNKIKEKIKYE